MVVVISLSLFLIKTVLATDISACQALSTNTYYNLTSNITAALNSNCFTTSGNNITLECNGYTILGNGSGYGIYESKSNIYVHNCIFENWTGAFAVFKTGANGIYENITVQSNSGSFRIYTGGDNNTLNNFVMEGTAYLYFYGENKDNIINNLTGGLSISTGTNNTIINNWTLTGTTYAPNIQGLNTTINKLNKHNSAQTLDFQGNNIFVNDAILQDNSGVMRLKTGTSNINFNNLTLNNDSFSADGVPNLSITNSRIYNSTSFILTRSLGTSNFTNLVFENNSVENHDLEWGAIENGVIKNNNFSNLYLIFKYENSYNVNISLNKFSNASINSDSNQYKNNFKIFNNTFLNSPALEHPGIYINYLNNFEIYNNTMLNNNRGITLNYASNGLIYNNNIRHGGHGILLNQRTYNVTVYDNYVENESYSYLFEWGTYNCTMHNNNMSNGGVFYSLHNTHDNIVYNNYIDGDLILHNNVTNELFYNNTVTMDLIFRVDYELGNGTGAFNNIIKDTHIQGNLEVKENSTNNILLNVTWGGTETVDGVNISSYSRKWYLDSSSNINNTNITIKNSTGDVIYSNLINGSISQQTLLSYINTGGTKTYYSNYTITASASGYATNTTSINLTSNANIIFSLNENVAPTISIVSPTNITYTTTTITFNVSTNENTSWCGFSLDNAANITMTRKNDTYFNYTNSSMTQGSHSIVFSCNDTLGNMNASSGTRIFSVDSVAPVISLVSPADSASSTSTSWEFIFNVSDISATNCSLILDGSIINFNSSVNISGGATSFTNSSSVGSHSWSVNCTDINGNTGNSSSRSFTITSLPTSQSSTSGGSYPTFSLVQEQIEKGIEKVLYKNWEVSFNLGNESHKIKVNNISNSSAIITLSSSSITLTLFVGEEKKVNLNNDNFYDLYLKLNSIKNNYANLTIKSIYEEIPAEKKEAEENLEEEKNPADKTGEVEKSGLWLWIAVLVIIIALSVIFSLRRFRKKK